MNIKVYISFKVNNILIIIDNLTNGFKFEIISFIYLFSIIFGIFIIISRNPVISVLYLIGLFVSLSIILILIGFNFIGLSYILVYVGAVSILFLFILMLINIRISELLSETNNDIPLAILTLMLFFYIIGGILPINSLDNKTYSKIVDIFEIYNIQPSFSTYENIVYISSKTWDNLLVEISHISAIGNIIYTNYAIWLIIVSVILLLAMVGSIVITVKQK
jgi:NADH-ubiquinone oxidoreductase chain 6